MVTKIDGMKFLERKKNKKYMLKQKKQKNLTQVKLPLKCFEREV